MRSINAVQSRRLLSQTLLTLLISAATLAHGGCQSTTAARRFDTQRAESKRPPFRRYESKPTTAEEFAAQVEAEEEEDLILEEMTDISRYNRALSGARIPVNARLAVENEITKYIGIRYKHAGRDANGFDCSGFVFRVYHDAVGVDLPYSASTQARLGFDIPKESLQFGDLVFFNVRGRGISHVGIYVGDGKFAHASLKRGITITELNDKYYKPKFVRARRIIPLDQAAELPVQESRLDGQ